LIVGACTLCGIGLAVGLTKAGLELIISLIPARAESAAKQEPAQQSLGPLAPPPPRRPHSQYWK
jgi:hypothetical protein